MDCQFAFFCVVPPSNEDMMYYYPAPSYSYQIPPQIFSEQQNTVDNRQSMFYSLVEKQIKYIGTKYKKKVWTKAQDQLLLRMRSEKRQWAEIVREIRETNIEICKRRFERLKEEEKKWPSEFEEEIRNICSLQDVKWEQKRRILIEKFPSMQGYSQKMIKERYLTYLKEGIEQKPWAIQQDLQLVEMLKKGQRKWKLMARQLPGRTELHLKNRYYGFLRSICKKVENQMLNYS